MRYACARACKAAPETHGGGYEHSLALLAAHTLRSERLPTRTPPRHQRPLLWCVRVCLSQGVEKDFNKRKGDYAKLTEQGGEAFLDTKRTEIQQLSDQLAALNV